MTFTVLLSGHEYDFMLRACERVACQDVIVNSEERRITVNPQSVIGNFIMELFHSIDEKLLGYY